MKIKLLGKAVLVLMVLVIGPFTAAFAEEGPALIVVPIDYRENALLTERLGNIACSI